MGIKNSELLSDWQNSGSDGVERESDQDRLDRKNAETQAARKGRQVRLGHVPAPEESEEE